MNSDFTVTVEASATGPVLALVGDLDLYTVPQVRALLRDLPLSSGGHLFVDLRRLTFCDSTGITFLIEACNRADAAEADFALVAAPAPVQRVLRIVGLTELLPMYDDVDAAVRAATARRAAG